VEEIISWLLALIGFPTAADGDGALPCVSFLAEELSRRNVAVRRFTTDGGARQAHHLLAVVPGERAESVLLHAHLDTAPCGRKEDWHFPADRATRLSGFICGRGAIDCKGPLAVWMKLLSDAAAGKRRPYTLKLLVTDLEEQGGEEGAGLLLARHPELLQGLKLVIGEGGGFPFPFGGHIFFTFQTEERENWEPRSQDAFGEAPDQDQIAKTISLGIKKGYYSAELLEYAAMWDSLLGRKLDIRPLYEGMDAFFEKAADSALYARYGPLFASALREHVPDACLMPCITPGTSDNRWFRKAGIPVVGFFPLARHDPLGGIHGADECISEASLSLAYRTLTRILEGL
jgi:acetylornithine deacetylase/succinyl-diaminopimelate desuccinylase-like protein